MELYSRIAGYARPGTRFQGFGVSVQCPGCGTYRDYLWLLGRMQFARSHKPLPPYPETAGAKRTEWEAKQKTMYEEMGQAQQALYQRAVDLLPQKQAAAKASTIAAFPSAPDSPGTKARISDAEIASVFPLIDEQQQATILDIFSWRITSPTMIGPLEAILDKPRISSDLRIGALQALLKVSPERGRVHMLAEIRQPHAESLNNLGFLARCLGALPDKTLPELNDVLADRLENTASPTRDLDAQLIGRYATAAILNRVKKIYRDETDWDCSAENGLVQYFLRVDHEYGLSLEKTQRLSCAPESKP